VIQRLIVLGNEKAIIEELTAGTKIDSIPGQKNKIVSMKKSRPSLKEVYRDAVKKAESETMLKALETTNWNRKKAANILEINYKTLLYKIKEYGLDKRFIS
jgi:DNA-binding NtrC family response regulator